MKDLNDDPVLAAIGRELVRGVAHASARQRRRRHQVQVAACVLAVAGLATGGLIATQRLTGTTPTEVAAVGDDGTLADEAGVGAATGEEPTWEVTIDRPPLGGGPLVVLDRNGRPLDLADPTLASVIVDVARQLSVDGGPLGFDASTNAALVADGGLVVTTTIDLDAHRLAIEARDGPDGDRRRTMLVAVDPATGAIRVLAGHPFENLQGERFEAAVDVEEGAGYTLIPLVLAAAIDRAGLFPDDPIDGTGPCEFRTEGGIVDSYRVHNDVGVPDGEAPLGDHLVRVNDCALVRLGVAIGFDTIIDTATDLGVPTETDRYLGLPLALALGGTSVSSLELAVGYASLAAGGIRRDPYLIEDVAAGGRVLYGHRADDGTAAISSDAACRVTETLSVRTTPGAELPGVASVSGASPDRDGGHRWVYYAGYTPALASVVLISDPSWWPFLGIPESEFPEDVPLPDSSSPGVAAESAAGVWGRFNRGWLEQFPPEVSTFPTCPPPDRDPRPITGSG